MIGLPLQTLAQLAVERLLNALPEGFLVALFAWSLLRVLRKQNSGTRFAVWFLALLTVAALPLLYGFGEGRELMATGTSWAMSPASVRPAIIVPGSWAFFVFLAWAIGACLGMVRLASGLWRLKQLRRSCTPIVTQDLDPIVRQAVDAIIASNSASNSVAVATSDCVRVPSAIGFWRRTIVLPTWTLQELPSEDLKVILLHEFAHLRRWDDWTNLIQKIVRALFFFHPAVWWIENRLSVEREMACDDAVLAETANPQGYASCLVSLLERSLAHRLSHRQRSMAHAAVDRAREASLRLAQILDQNRPATTRIWKPALAMVGVFSLACLMALSHAPQLVAVDTSLDRSLDRSPQATDSGHAYSSALRAPSFQSSLSQAALSQLLLRKVADPVAFRAGASSSAKSGAKVTRDASHKCEAGAPQPAPLPLVASRLNSAPLPEQVVAVKADADQQQVTQFQTLVFFEATPYMTSDSVMWRVQVWRVTLVSAQVERLARVPVANSI